MEQGEEPQYPVMLDILLYMTHHPDLFHHPREELMFARICQRLEQPSELIEQLREEHRINGQRSLKLLDMLRAVVNGSLVSQEELGEACHEYVRGQRLHIAREESGLYRLAEAHLTEEDWESLDVDAEKRANPFADKLRRRYLDFYQEICRASEVKPLHTH